MGSQEKEKDRALEYLKCITNSCKYDFFIMVMFMTLFWYMQWYIAFGAIVLVWIITDLWYGRAKRVLERKIDIDFRSKPFIE